MIKNKYTEIPPLKIGSKIANSTIEKAEMLASAFSSSYVLTQNYVHKKTNDRVIREAKKITTSHSAIDNKAIKKVYPSEILRIIRKLKAHKSPGIDKLDNAILKRLPGISILYLTNIFNACLSFGYFPTTWKTAMIHPIRKPNKDPSIPINYRPISLLPSLSKIFEKIILSRLKESLNEKIINEQFGFREKHSTTHQLNRLTEHISANYNMKKSTGLLLLDVEKAFDTVWHDGLLYKISKLKAPRYLLHIIKSYLKGRSYVVSLNKELSEPRKIPAGVPREAFSGRFFSFCILTIFQH